MIFSNDFIKIRQYYGNDIFEYIYSLKVFMFMCIAIYFLRITINLIENFILENPITFSEFFIILDSENCDLNEFCYISTFVSTILLSGIILYAIKEIYESIESNCIDFL